MHDSDVDADILQPGADLVGSPLVEPDLDVRMRIAEPVERRQQQMLDHRPAGPDPQLAGRMVAQRFHLPFAGVEQRQRLLHEAEQVLALGGQRDAFG